MATAWRRVVAVTGAGFALAFGSTGGAEAASIWRALSLPAEVGATDTITAIEYQSETRFWFTTSDGQIYRRAADGGFQQVLSAPTVSFTDIEFQRGAGVVGLAVGQNGAVYRSADAGQTWTALNLDFVASNTPFCTETRALGDVSAVRFARDNRAYLLAGDQRQYLRTPPSATASDVGTAWEDLNRKPANGCRSTVIYHDAFFVREGATMGGYFGGGNTVLYTEPGDTPTFSANAQSRSACTSGQCRLAGDPSATNRQWAADGASLDTTTDNWETASYKRAKAGQDPFPDVHDLAFAGGTVVAAGTAGTILTAADGVTFHEQPADAPLDKVNWRAVSGYDAKHFAIGGEQGKLLVSDTADFTPDVVPPTVSISGPAQLVAGESGTYDAGAADTGGSGVASVSWTASGGLPAQTGSPVTYTFPVAGTYTLRARATDAAGNESEEKALAVRVSAPQQPQQPSQPAPDLRPEPKLVLSGANKPVAREVKDKRGRRKVLITVKGALTVPAGVDKAAACKGELLFTVSNKKKNIATRKTRLNRACRYKKVISFLRGRLKDRRVAVRIVFPGNAKLKGIDVRGVIRIRKQF